VSRLVGAPPGYVGYEDAGQLTEALRRRPYSIVVFDEIEKAHPEAHNMLLQIMEEGHLSDARGKKVNFQNAIIVMTSNIGAELIKRQTSMGFAVKRDEADAQQFHYDDMYRTLTESLKKVFRPEFLNRVDGVVVFRALSKPEISQIVDLEVNKVALRVAEHHIKIEMTPEGRALLADMGYDPEMGARPLRRVIQAKIEDALSDGMLSGEFKDGDDVRVEVRDNDVKLIAVPHPGPSESEAPEAPEALPAL